MGQVHCARCGSTAAGLESAPLPGAVGRRVQAGTCRACWKAWLEMQVILINERGLAPADPEHFRSLVREMQTFLGLHEDEPEA